MAPAIGILIILLVLGLSTQPAQAGTRIPGHIPGTKWKGCNPPATMKPAPKFRCGEEVIDTSTGQDRDVKIAYLTAAQFKGWYVWTYWFTDGSGAHSGTLRRK